MACELVWTQTLQEGLRHGAVIALVCGTPGAVGPEVGGSCPDHVVLSPAVTWSVP